MWPYVVSAAFVVSALINIFLVWYCVKVLRELFSVSGTLEDLFVDVEAFKKHLQGVYELEMFYGDQTLENLLSHARALSKEFDRYEILFSLKEPLEDDDFDEEDDTDST
jgi:hypothetical protein